MSDITPSVAIVTFKNAAAPTFVYKNANGTWTCPCCHKGYKKPSTLRNHAKKNELPTIPSSIPEEPLLELPVMASPALPAPSAPPVPAVSSASSVQNGSQPPPLIIDSGTQAPDELFSDKLLESLNYTINPRGGFLVCMTCKEPHLVCSASNHAHNKHQLPKFNADIVLKNYITRFRLFKSTDDFKKKFMPSPPPNPLPPPPVEFQGLNSMPAYLCSQCIHAAGTVASMKAHWSTNHAGLPFPQPEVGLAQLMVLTPQFGRWLPVRPRLSSGNADDALTACLAAYSNLPQNLAPADVTAREPPPWLKKIGWLKWIEKYDMPAVNTFLKSVHSHKLFQPMQELLTEYLEDAMDELVEMQPQIRQILRSITTLVGAAMFNPPDSEETIKRYAGIMTFVILCQYLLTFEENPPIPLLLNTTQSNFIEHFVRILVLKHQPDTNLIRAMQDVLMSLLIHQFKGVQVHSTGDPVIMSLVWYNMLEDGSFKRAGQITQTFAAIQFVARSTALWQILNKTRESGSSHLTDYYRELSLLHPLMIQGSSSPLGNIYGFWVIALKAAMEETAFADFMYTSPDDLAFTYKGSPGTVDDLRTMIDHHLDESERILFKDLLFGLDFAPILSNLTPHIYDDTSNITPDYSFLVDARNHYPNGYKMFMEKVIGAEDAKTASYLGLPVSGQWVWSKSNCIQWLDSCQRFLQHLLVASHMTHGQPTRGSELMCTTFANLPNYPRSIVFLADEPVNALAPNKSESMTMNRKISPHWFCPQNARQLYIYLLLVRPVEIAITTALFPNIANNYRYFLYTGPKGRWTSKQFSRLLKSTTRDFLGVNSSFGLADMRQILIGLCHRHCNSVFSEMGSKSVSELFAEEIGDSQANHSTQTRKTHYAIQKSEMGRVSSEKVKALRVYSRGVQAFFKVSQIKSVHSTTTITTGGSDDSNTNSDQPPHPSINHTALLHSVQSELDDLKEEVRMSLGEMKKSLQESLQMSVAESANAIIKAIKDDSTSSPSYNQAPSPSFLIALQTFDPSITRFRSQQQATALANVLSQKEHQLVVLPTGEGKSLLWMMPAKTVWMDKAVIVVVPFVSLLLDMQERCRRQDIKHDTWQSRLKPISDHGVIFVSVEHATSQDFHKFALGLQSRRQLACIVIDECHLVLTAPEYRRQLPDLKNLFGIGAPLLCTTATMPPHLIPKFKSDLDISQIQVTRRTNEYRRLRISVDIQPNRSARIDAVVHKATQWLRTLDHIPGSFMIICRSINECKEVAGRLGVRPYHGKLSAEEKREIFQDFQSGNTKVLVATTAAGTGSHKRGLLAIMHCGISFDMFTFAQNIGRAGRDGEVAFSYIVADPTQHFKPDGEDILGAAALDDLVFNEHQCRKLPLSSFLEGTIMSCLSNDDVLCDVCQRTLEQAGCQYKGLSDLTNLLTSDKVHIEEPSMSDDGQHWTAQEKGKAKELIIDNTVLSQGWTSRKRLLPTVEDEEEEGDRPPPLPRSVRRRIIQPIQSTFNEGPSHLQVPLKSTNSRLGHVLVPDTPPSHVRHNHSLSAIQQSFQFHSKPPSPLLSQASIATTHVSQSSMALKMQQSQTNLKKMDDHKYKDRMEEEILESLLSLKDSCILCWLKTDEIVFEHTAVQCPMIEHRAAMLDALKAVRIPTVPGREYTCYACYLPLTTFSKYNHGSVREQDQCDFHHIFRPLIWACWHFDNLREQIITQFRPHSYRGIPAIDVDQWSDFFDWCFRLNSTWKKMANYPFLLTWACKRSKVIHLSSSSQEKNHSSS